MQLSPTTNPEKRERGSVVVEFLFVFPAFLLLSLFTIELSLSWIDRHITRLAAYEAGRVFVAAELPEWDANGKEYDSPCEAPEVKKRARQAALRKIAIVSPTVPLFLAKLGGIASGLNAGALPSVPQGGGLSGAALRRILLRWPTAVASTELSCHFEPTSQKLRIKLTYQRMPQTPFVDRVLYLVHRFNKANLLSTVSLDENFNGITATGPAALAAAQAKQALEATLGASHDLGLSVADAGALLKDVPGIAAIFASTTPAPTDLSPALQQAQGATLLALNNQSGVLSGLANVVPEALRRIPIEVELELQRDGMPEPAWVGDILGGVNLSAGSKFRTWGKKLSEPQANLRQDSKPLEEM